MCVFHWVPSLWLFKHDEVKDVHVLLVIKQTMLLCYRVLKKEMVSVVGT